MKKYFSILFALFPIYMAHSQVALSYRTDTLCIEQKWRKHLTGVVDTSYISICIPSTEIVPDFDLNYDWITISCTDGAVLRLFQSPRVPVQIESSFYDTYNKDSVDAEIGNTLLSALDEEFFTFTLLGEHRDTSLYHPICKTYEGVDENELWWKVIKIEYITISYENIPLHKKQFYDDIIKMWHFVPYEKVKGFHYLPLYK